MKCKSARPSIGGTALGVAAALAAVFTTVGCGKSKGPTEPVGGGAIPTMPTPLTGTATLAGHVLDETGAGVAGASLRVAETDAVASADADGAFTLDVPSDSTLTVVASASGFAPTYRDAVMLASQAAVGGFDFLLLGQDRVAGMNALATDNQTTGGVVAVRLHSLDAGCDPTGAHLALWPPKGGTVLYSRPSASGGIDEPDPTVDGVQLGAATGAWIAGAITPGNQLSITVDQAGCQLTPQSPSMGGMLFTGLRQVAAGALTLADLYLEVSP